MNETVTELGPRMVLTLTVACATYAIAPVLPLLPIWKGEK